MARDSSTVSILIGNTDNKLMQLEWSNFVMQTKDHIYQLAQRVHFFGAPPNWEVWQNACWVIEIEHDRMPELTAGLVRQ